MGVTRPHSRCNDVGAAAATAAADNIPGGIHLVVTLRAQACGSNVAGACGVGARRFSVGLGLGETALRVLCGRRGRRF